MAVVFDEYKPQTFDALGSPDTAYEKLKNNKGEDLLDTKLKDTVFAHNMQMIFGFTLLHRHFDLQADERVVAADLTSTPWNEASMANIKATGLGSVLPSSWMFSEGKVTPFEYIFMPQGQGSDVMTIGGDAIQAFLHDVSKVIQDYGIEGVLGLRRRPAGVIPETLEFTVGRANINMLRPIEKSNIPTSWFYELNPNDPNQIGQCRCYSHCMPENGKHLLLSHVHV